MSVKCLFPPPCRAPVTSVCLQTSLLLTKPRISSAKVIYLRRQNWTHTSSCRWVLGRNANLPSFFHLADVAHYYLFCSPNLPNPFQQVSTKSQLSAYLCSHLPWITHWEINSMSAYFVVVVDIYFNLLCAVNRILHKTSPSNQLFTQTD